MIKKMAACFATGQVAQMNRADRPWLMHTDKNPAEKSAHELSAGFFDLGVGK
jgi:hypothetical protein